MPKDKEIDKNKLFHILNKLDKDLDGIQRKVKLYFVGGTILVFSGLRSISKDIDFIVSRKDFQALSSHAAELEYKEKVRIDIFPDGEMPYYKYQNYLINAEYLLSNFKNLELYRIDDTDFLLTKALAGRDRDYDDIKTMKITKESVKREELLKRFKNIVIEKNKEDELKKRFEKFLIEFYS